MKSGLIAILFLAAVLLSGCRAALTAPPAQPDPAPQTLTVFAAASLSGAFGELGQAFEAANPGVRLAFNFGGSQSLRTQIEQGAAADIFASANQKEMDALVSSGFVAAGSPQIFAANQLVVILPPGNPASLIDLGGLARPGVKIVLAAREVPAGNYALQVLDKLDTTLGPGYKAAVLANAVSYETDVKQVATRVQLGEADAGIAYRSDAAASPDLLTIPIPAESNVTARYPMAVLTQTSRPDLAHEFGLFVLSPQGQAILKKWGFAPPA